MLRNILHTLFLFLPLLAHGQIIVTAVGTGVPSDAGDGGPGTAASVYHPGSVTVGKDGALYICDQGNYKIRKLSPPFYGGIITTVAGDGTAGASGDGGWALEAQLCCPVDVAADRQGNVYIVEAGIHKIRKVTAATGIITTIAGTGVAGYNGDGIPATNAQLNEPYGICIDDTGNLYIADSRNYRYRKIDTTGIITTIAGTGISGYTPDGAKADTSAVSGIASPKINKNGQLIICDNIRIRKIDENGCLVTLAGTGIPGYTGEGGPATAADIAFETIDVDTFNNIYMTGGIDRARKVDAAGIITTIAGDGAGGYGGDWGPPILAKIYFAIGIAVAPNGDIFIGDAGNDRVRMITTHVTEVAQQTAVGSAFTVYPNPATGSITVAVPQTMAAAATISVCNAYGQLMTTVPTTTHTTTTLPTHWPPGIYFVTAHTPQQTYHATVEVR